MIVIIYPALVAILGALAYALSTNARVQELGRITFFCGLFWTVYVLIGHTTRVLP